MRNDSDRFAFRSSLLAFMASSVCSNHPIMCIKHPPPSPQKCVSCASSDVHLHTPSDLSWHASA